MQTDKSIRVGRVNEVILRELTLILKNKIKDPRLKNITISTVITSSDLSSAKVFFHTKENNTKEIAKILNNKSQGFLRSALANSINLRNTPKLNFIYDSSAKTAIRIDELLLNLND